jgi:hypothetical protein
LVFERLIAQVVSSRLRENPTFPETPPFVYDPKVLVYE